MPGHRTPFVDKHGRVSAVWYRFLFDLHERTGGGATDKVAATETAAEAAQAAADTAQAAADSLEIDREFDFNLDLR